jgi:hypothetical protein
MQQKKKWVTGSSSKFPGVELSLVYLHLRSRRENSEMNFCLQSCTRGTLVIKHPIVSHCPYAPRHQGYDIHEERDTKLSSDELGKKFGA